MRITRRRGTAMRNLLIAGSARLLLTMGAGAGFGDRGLHYRSRKPRKRLGSKSRRLFSFRVPRRGVGLFFRRPRQFLKLEASCSVTAFPFLWREPNRDDRCCRPRSQPRHRPCRKFGEILDLFATYALFVTQEDAGIGIECLDALRSWALRDRAIH
jgi:hypothetical protein